MKTNRSEYYISSTEAIKKYLIKHDLDIDLAKEAYDVYCWHCVTNPMSFVEFLKNEEEKAKWIDVVKRPGYSKTAAA